MHGYADQPKICLQHQRQQHFLDHKVLVMPTAAVSRSITRFQAAALLAAHLPLSAPVASSSALPPAQLAPQHPA
jgi:hypothetical protein